MLIEINLIQMKFDTLLSEKVTVTYHRKTDVSAQFPISLGPISLNIYDRGGRSGSYEAASCICRLIWEGQPLLVWYEISPGNGLFSLIHYQVIQSN